MKKKHRKYSISRIARVIGVAGIMVILYFSVQLKANSNIKRVEVTLKSSTKEKLIAKTDIIKYLNKSLNKDLEIETIEKIEITKIEKLLDQSKFIKNSDVFLDSKNNLHIFCTLRDPIVRIVRNNSKDFYLDVEGESIPISKRATVRVPIVSGHLKNIDISKINEESNLLNKIWNISKKINSDEFLKALIEQMYIDEKSELTLIPKLGRQEIEFGEWAQINDKLDKIKTIYKTGMNGAAWNKFEKINLNWEGQVVITKRN